jgi:hypothetical protein
MYLTCINNSVVEKIYGMAYVFTLLMFRKPNKTTTKIKRQICISQRPFDFRLYLDISRSSSENNRLYLDISRSIKCPKSSSVVCLICYYFGRFVSCFCTARIHFKSSHTRQF